MAESTAFLGIVLDGDFSIRLRDVATSGTKERTRSKGVDVRRSLPNPARADEDRSVEGARGGEAAIPGPGRDRPRGFHLECRRSSPTPVRVQVRLECLPASEVRRAPTRSRDDAEGSDGLNPEFSGKIMIAKICEGYKFIFYYSIDFCRAET